MTIIVPSWLGVPDPAAAAGWVVSWGPMLNGDSGQSLIEASNQVDHADRSIQVEGTFGATGVLVFEGSNDGVNFRTLNDPSLTPLSFTTAALRAVLEAARQVRPRITAGDGTTNLTVSLLLRRLR
jgi:hypothetical protein